jgi:hypothetical protein
MGNSAYNFEVFTGRAQQVAEDPAISLLGKRGKISMNNASFEALRKPKFVELLYDRAQNAVGIRAKMKKESHTYPVQAVTGSRSYIVSAQAFFAFSQIEKTSKRYQASLVGDVLVVDLKGPFEDVGRIRSTE